MNLRRKRILPWVAVALFANPAWADDTDDIRSLLSESIITTASTSAQKASTAPATSVTFTAEDLRVYGIRSLDEAINFLSLGAITSDPLTTPDIGARGVLLPGDGGKHFLLLVNGHAMNDPLYGAARFDQGAGFPIDMVDHIEVIVGPGSVLYGSNAMMGVINVITKNASDYRGGHAFGEYEFGRSYRAGAGTGFTFKAFGQPSEITASVEYFSRFGPNLAFDNMQTPINLASGKFLVLRRGGPADGVWGGTLGNAYFTEAPSAMLRFRTGDLEVNLMASAYRRGIPYTNETTNVDFDDDASSELDRSIRFDIKHQANLSSLVQLTSRIYGDSFDYQRRVNRDAEAGCFQSHFQTCQYYDAGLSRWAGVEERVSLNWLGNLSLVTLLGVDGRMRWVGAKEEALDYDTGRPFAATTGKISANAGLISPYVQQTWNPVSWLDLNGGARLDADQRFSPILSPRGAVAVSPSRRTTLKAIYSQAFRAPTWSETDASNYRQAVSEDIRPEVARSVEGTIEQRFGTHRILFGVFRTGWSNLVEPTALSAAKRAELQSLPPGAPGKLPITANNIVQFRNVSSIENYGWNGGLSGAFGESRLAYGLNATAAFTRRTSPAGDQVLDVAPRFFGNARVSYVAGGLVPVPALAAYYVARRPADGTFDGLFSTAPYAPPMAEFRATISGRMPGLSGWSYRASGAYVTASRGAYYVGPVGSNNVLAPAQLVPIDQFRVFLGLRYDFLTGAEATASGEQP